MSFYGNVFYELTNAFSSFIIKNSGKTKKDFITPSSSPVEVTSVGLGGKFNIDTGNKWLGLKGNFDNKSCHIYHSQIDTTDQSHSANAFAKQDTAVEGAIELSPGGYIKTVQFYYDDAGHVTGTTPTFYRLPQSETEKDIESLKDRMTKIEKADGEQAKELEGFTTSLNSANDKITGVSNRTGTLEGIVGARSSFTFDNNKTIASVIGPTDSFNTNYGSNTISGVFEQLSGRIDGSARSIENNDLVVKVAIKNLCDALQANGINVDYNSLWTEE